ncbi:MAG: RNA polymerase sigma factor [Bacillus sp. (in: firmicutes)]
MPEDHELVKEIQAGSQAAMEVLTRKYYKPIYAFVYRKIVDKETAYDLTQEIFIKMMQRISTYTNEGKFSSWIFTIAINHCRDYWRSKEYKVSSQQTELPEVAENEQNNVTYIFERKEAREQVKQAMQTLPEYQREAILLKYYQHFKIREIAVITKTSDSTVKSRLRQGITKLAAMLRREEEADVRKREKGRS